MAKQNVRKFTLALQDEARIWAEFEAIRRGVSLTQNINAAILEQRDHASDEVREAFEVYLNTRVEQEQ